MPHSPVFAKWFKIADTLYIGENKEIKIEHVSNANRGEVYKRYEQFDEGGTPVYLLMDEYPTKKKYDQFTGGVYDSTNGYYYSDTVWTACAATGTGTMAPYAAYPGGIAISSGLTNGNYCVLAEGENRWDYDKEIIMDWCQSNSGSWQHTQYQGLSNTAGTHYAWFKATHGSNYFFRTNDGVAEEATDTGLTSSGGPYRMTIYFEDAATVKAYINNTLVATHTVRVPTDSLNMRFLSQITTDSAAHRSIRIWWVNCLQQVNRW